jgi:hypothetical protein
MLLYISVHLNCSVHVPVCMNGTLQQSLQIFIKSDTGQVNRQLPTHFNYVSYEKIQMDT